MFQEVKMKKLALLFSISLITILSYHYISAANTLTYLNVPFLEQSNLEEKIAGLTPVAGNTIGQFVLFEGTTILYDSTSGASFITIGENYTGNFETKGGISLYWMYEFDENDAATAIANNEAISLLAIYNGTYEIISLKISTLPIVSFSTQEDKQTITIINADDTATNRYTTTTYYMEYAVRGQTSAAFDKKPYKVSLMDENGDRQAESLFGLRTDDDWNFNAVFGDITSIREALVLNLLQQMSNSAETTTMHSQNSQFCELFIDNVYKGIYQVIEPMDTQQVDIVESTDYLYKASSLVVFDAELYATYNTLLDETDVQIVAKSYPANAFDTRYDPLIAYYSFIAGEQTAEGVSLFESTLDEIATVIDIDNLIDLSIANIVFSLWDNNKKNFMVVITEQEDGSTLASREYFDFNYSFGDAYAPDVSDASDTFALTTSVSASEISTDIIFDQFSSAACYDELIALYQTRYTSLRETVLSEENILSVAESYYTTLANSGAYSRDASRWGSPDNAAEEYDLLVEYIVEHLAVVDEYVATLSE